MSTMAEEKQTLNTEINDTLTQDDTAALREVLQSAHIRGVTPVSMYDQVAELIEPFESE